MSGTKRDIALSFAVVLVIMGWLASGCLNTPGNAADSKKEGVALSGKNAKTAGSTVRSSLQKNTRAGRAVDGETKGQPGRQSKPAVLRIPETQYPAADTAKLAAIMDEIQLTPEPYYYASVGRRDLFEPLVTGESKRMDPDSEPTSHELRVVGILWAERDRFALVESPDGRSRILREGDRLGDGIVTRVMPDRVMVHVTEYGSSRTVTMPLVQGGFDGNPQSHDR